MNLPGIAGLHASLGYLKEIGIDSIRAHEQNLSGLLQQGLSSFPSVRIVGIADAQKRAPVVSVDFIGYDNAQIAYLLDSEHQVMTRCGPVSYTHLNHYLGFQRAVKGGFYHV